MALIDYSKVTDKEERKQVWLVKVILTFILSFCNGSSCSNCWNRQHASNGSLLLYRTFLDWI